MDPSGLLQRIAFSAAIAICVPTWPLTLSICDDLKPDPERSPSIRDHELYVDCIKKQVIDLSNTSKPTIELRSVGEEDPMKATKDQAKDVLEDKLTVAEATLHARVNEAFFNKQSNFVGIAFLRQAGAGDTNDTVEITGLQYIKSLNDKKTFGIGGFFAINFTGETEIQAADYVGVGLAVSGRVAETAHPISFGLGYMIDRVGFSVDSGDGETTRRGDRSGIFIALWFNPISTIQPFLRATKSSN